MMGLTVSFDPVLPWAAVISLGDWASSFWR